jgi:hypothetical protein
VYSRSGNRCHDRVPNTQLRAIETTVATGSVHSRSVKQITFPGESLRTHADAPNLHPESVPPSGLGDVVTAYPAAPAIGATCNAPASARPASNRVNDACQPPQPAAELTNEPFAR